MGSHRLREVAKASFIEPMLLLRTDRLPDGPEWIHEINLEVIADRYHFEAFSVHRTLKSIGAFAVN
jgi:hypothetical protein